MTLDRHPAVIGDDLPGIYAHIARDNPSAAERVLDAVEATFALIAAQPESGVQYPTRKYPFSPNGSRYSSPGSGRDERQR